MEDKKCNKIIYIRMSFLYNANTKNEQTYFQFLDFLLEKLDYDKDGSSLFFLFFFF